MPIQQMLLGVGAVATKTYVDDVFSTFLYKGNNGNTLNINNGIDLTGEGGMTWIKCRDTGSTNHSIYDTVRGASELLWANSNAAQMDQTGCGSNKALYQFNNNGFTLGGDCNGTENWDQKAFSSWTFRKAKGFFDVVTYTGNGSNRTISHDLGCVPGCYMIKRTDTATDWKVFHRSLKGKEWYLELNTTDQQYDMGGLAPTAPTASEFSVGTDSSGWVNANGGTYVCYLFAGGESTAATARSVDFDGTNDYLYIGDSADWILGDTFTLEAWIKLDSIGSGDTLCAHSTTKGFLVFLDSTNERIRFYDYDMDMNVSSANESLKVGQWTHVALVNNSGTAQWYIDGIASGSSVSNFDVDFDEASNFALGSRVGGSNYLEGKVSNFRIVKGTAVYTSAFRPPTEPLTNITNTKLLCCNNSSITGSTVTPGTITAVSSPTASTDSPFDDPAAHIFGESGSESVIKTGSFVGNAANGLEVNIGWEPSWVLIKNASATEDWFLFDNMRGVTTGGNDNRLQANSNGSEFTTFDYIDFTSTGFKVNNNGGVNGDGNTMIYIAIRRPDGYVGKPPELGTGVFTMDTGNSSTTIPTFDSGFPVDFGLYKDVDSTGSWAAGLRLIGTNYLQTDTTADESAFYKFVYDSNVGWYVDATSDYQSWMWKRHAGFDVVTFDGISGGAWRPHGLSKIPEMIWIKDRSASEAWQVYHHGVNGGTNPEQYEMVLNTNAAQYGDSYVWNNLAPTATHFRTGSYDRSGANTSHTYIAMLFASVDGISKVGSYDGSDSAQTISLGFQPRFVIIKATNSAQNWIVLDTVRGWGSGADQFLQLDHNDSQSGLNIGAPTSTGMSLDGNVARTNDAGTSYIYYAHA